LVYKKGFINICGKESSSFHQILTLSSFISHEYNETLLIKIWKVKVKKLVVIAILHENTIARGNLPAHLIPFLDVLKM